MRRDHHHPVGAIAEDPEAPAVARAGTTREVPQRGAANRPPPPGAGAPLDTDARPVVLRAGAAAEADPFTDLGRPVADSAADPDPNAHGHVHAEEMAPAKFVRYRVFTRGLGEQRNSRPGRSSSLCRHSPSCPRTARVPLEPNGLAGIGVRSVPAEDRCRAEVDDRVRPRADSQAVLRAALVSRAMVRLGDGRDARQRGDGYDKCDGTLHLCSLLATSVNSLQHKAPDRCSSRAGGYRSGRGRLDGDHRPLGSERSSVMPTIEPSSPARRNRVRTPVPRRAAGYAPERRAGLRRIGLVGGRRGCATTRAGRGSGSSAAGAGVHLRAGAGLRACRGPWRLGPSGRHQLA